MEKQSNSKESNSSPVNPKVNSNQKSKTNEPKNPLKQEPTIVPGGSSED